MVHDQHQWLRGRRPQIEIENRWPRRVFIEPWNESVAVLCHPLYDNGEMNVSRAFSEHLCEYGKMAENP